MAMTVGDLKKFIQDLPDDMQVILQKDSEGNGYSPLDDMDADSIYEWRTPWSGDVWRTKWSASDADITEAEWAEFKTKYPRCLVLAPVN